MVIRLISAPFVVLLLLSHSPILHVWAKVHMGVTCDGTSVKFAHVGMSYRQTTLNALSS